MTALGFKFIILIWALMVICALAMTAKRFGNIKRINKIKNIILITPVYCIISALLSLVILMILVCVGYGDSIHTKFNWNLCEPHTEYIYSIKQSTRSDVHSDFCLGTGSLQGATAPSYRYYAKNNGKYKLCEVCALNYDIVMTDSIQPQIVVDGIKRYIEPKRLNWMFGRHAITINVPKNEQTGTIYIPKNSIIESYDIN